MRLMRSAPHDKRDVASCQVGFNIRQALIEKNIVPKIGVREVRYAGKVNYQRQAQQICNPYCQINCMIIDPSLRALHPVDDTSSIGIGNSRSPYRNSRVVG